MPPYISTAPYRIYLCLMLKFYLNFCYTGIRYRKKEVPLANKCIIPECKNIAVINRQYWPWFTKLLALAPYFINVGADITDKLYLLYENISVNSHTINITKIIVIIMHESGEVANNLLSTFLLCDYSFI